MENKVVCHYCGTIYDAELKKCPLCGSVVQSDSTAIPQPRQRLTEKERRQRHRRGRFAAVKEKSPKALHIAALIFLAAAVLVVGYFIGDMLGWWGGLEDTVQRDGTSQTSGKNKDCTLLKVSEQKLQFDAAGETATLRLTMNADCDKTVTGSFSVANVADFKKSQDITVESNEKSVAVVVSALAEGETVLTFTCGDKTASCSIHCGIAGPEPTQPTEFEPTLNFGTELTLLKKGQTERLLVTDLPEGMAVTWSSADATIAKVNEYGELTAVSDGQTTIKATVNGKTAELSVRCVFNIEDVGAHLEAGRSDVSIPVGGTFELYLYDSESNHINDITYTVGDPSICKVTDGQVAALSRGVTTITITYYNLTFECIVRVK